MQTARLDMGAIGCNCNSPWCRTWAGAELRGRKKKTHPRQSSPQKAKMEAPRHQAPLKSGPLGSFWWTRRTEGHVKPDGQTGGSLADGLHRPPTATPSLRVIHGPLKSKPPQPPASVPVSRRATRDERGHTHHTPQLQQQGWLSHRVEGIYRHGRLALKLRLLLDALFSLCLSRQVALLLTAVSRTASRVQPADDSNTRLAARRNGPASRFILTRALSVPRFVPVLTAAVALLSCRSSIAQGSPAFYVLFTSCALGGFDHRFSSRCLGAEILRTLQHHHRTLRALHLF
jgi:hypothetical protein